MLKQGVLAIISFTLLVSGAAPATTADQPDEPVIAPASVVLNQWDGFLSCSLGSPVLVISVCSFEDLNDPHDDFLHTFTVQEDLKTIVVAMEWEPDMMVGSESLMINLEDEGTGLSGPAIAKASGPSPLEMRVDVGDSWDPDELPWDLQFRVFPEFDVSVVLQQPFTVHYHEFYGEHAPEGYSALPDA